MSATKVFEASVNCDTKILQPLRKTLESLLVVGAINYCTLGSSLITFHFC